MDEQDRHEAQAAMIDSRIEDYLEAMDCMEVQEIIARNADSLADLYVLNREGENKEKLLFDLLASLLEEEARTAVEDNLGI